MTRNDNIEQYSVANEAMKMMCKTFYCNIVFQDLWRTHVHTLQTSLPHRRTAGEPRGRRREVRGRAFKGLTHKKRRAKVVSFVASRMYAGILLRAGNTHCSLESL
jgi:hypothetical protein